MITNDIRKTGYSKIAQLVDMPVDADMTIAERLGEKEEVKENNA